MGGWFLMLIPIPAGGGKGVPGALTGHRAVSGEAGQNRL